MNFLNSNPNNIVVVIGQNNPTIKHALTFNPFPPTPLLTMTL